MQAPLSSPSRLLKEVNAHYGAQFWLRVQDALRLKQRGEMNWPDWCFLPMSGWSALLYGSQQVNHIEQAFELARMAAIGAWRYTQGIYRFDPAVLQALSETDFDNNIPSDVIYRLPEYCVYVEMPTKPLRGFFAHLEYDVNTERSELRFWVDDARRGFPFVLHIGDWTIEEAIVKALKVSMENATKAHWELAKPVIDESMAETIRLFSLFTQLLLYLASDEPDIDRVEQELPKRPQFLKNKRGLILEPPAKPKIWTVGTSLSKSITKWQKEPAGAEHASPRPHIRRAHWHGFWKGSHKAERTFFYKWIPPLIINSTE